MRLAAAASVRATAGSLRRAAAAALCRGAPRALAAARGLGTALDAGAGADADAARVASASASAGDPLLRARAAPRAPGPRRSLAPAMPPIKSRVDLTPAERALFDDLLAAVAAAGLGTTLRAAGGWVRDKLMGRESADIDVALDNMLGREFAEAVTAALAARAEAAGGGADPAAASKVAVIAANPAQSKHLETARLRLRGVWVDLVNLRSEAYADHSRIPSMAFGTPAQDAARRDFTINALFWNAATGEVEDWTGAGLADLRAGLLRTPLPPRETLLDDPLRVLRAVRFAARFGFALDPALRAAAADPDVRAALGHKVSRERVGAELEGMLAGPDPVAALRLLHALRLFEAVFEVHPSRSADVCRDAFGAAGAALAEGAHGVAAAWRGGGGGGGAPGAAVAASAEANRHLLLAALLLPLRGAEYAPTGKGGRPGKPAPLSAHVVREALKLRARDAEAVEALHAAAPRLLAAHAALAALPGGAAGAAAGAPRELRVALGRAVRQLRGLWREGCVLAALLPSPEAAPLGVAPGMAGDDAATAAADAAAAEPLDDDDGAAEAADLSLPEAVLRRRVEVCAALAAAVEALGLDGCWEWRPPLDGAAVAAALGVPRGPALGALMERVVDWQLARPGGTPDECRAWLAALPRAEVDALVAAAEAAAAAAAGGKKKRKSGGEPE